MSTASYSIFAENGSNTVRMNFRFTVKGTDGAPVTGEECTITLEGDGSLAPRHDAKSIYRTTNSEGSAEVVWYRRGIYGRDVHATLTVEAPTEGSISVETTTPTPEVRISRILTSPLRRR